MTAALISDKKLGLLRWLLPFFLADQNATGYIRDKCCYLQADGAVFSCGQRDIFYFMLLSLRFYNS